MLSHSDTIADMHDGMVCRHPINETFVYNVYCTLAISV